MSFKVLVNTVLANYAAATTGAAAVQADLQAGR